MRDREGEELLFDASLPAASREIFWYTRRFINRFSTGVPLPDEEFPEPPVCMLLPSPRLQTGTISIQFTNVAKIVNNLQMTSAQQPSQLRAGSGSGSTSATTNGSSQNSQKMPTSSSSAGVASSSSGSAPVPAAHNANVSKSMRGSLFGLAAPESAPRREEGKPPRETSNASESPDKKRTNPLLKGPTLKKDAIQGTPKNYFKRVVQNVANQELNQKNTSWLGGFRCVQKLKLFSLKTVSTR